MVERNEEALDKLLHKPLRNISRYRSISNKKFKIYVAKNKKINFILF